MQLQRQKKVLLKELGGEEGIREAMAVADDPNALGWKGRAAQIAQLQRQLKDFKGSTPVVREEAAKSKAVGQAAEKRREEFEKLQARLEGLKVGSLWLFQVGKQVKGSYDMIF